MFNDKEEDWKCCLSPEDQEVIAEMLEKTKWKKCAFMQADDVKIAQAWCALIDLKKEINQLRVTVEKTEAPFKDMATMGDIEKRKAIERIVRDMLKPEPDQEEATQRLVDSLMQF
jgi:cell pole-organizing protein PopZ